MRNNSKQKMVCDKQLDLAAKPKNSEVWQVIMLSSNKLADEFLITNEGVG